jgi:molybdenum cofactor synthesis domain-containing protein
VSGPLIRDWIVDRGGEIIESVVLPDEENTLFENLRRLIECKKIDLIVTTGGTGLSPRDITPDTLSKLSAKLNGREVPGIGELLRQSGSLYTSSSWLSRSVAYLFDQTLVVTLPGSPKAVIEGLSAIEKLIGHAKKMSYGAGHDSRGKK